MQYCISSRKQNKNAEEWNGSLRIKAKECEYKEKDKRLKEQFINSTNNDDLMTKIKQELMAINKMNEVTGEPRKH